MFALNVYHGSRERTFDNSLGKWLQMGAATVVSSLAVRALEIIAQHAEDSLALGLPPVPFAGAAGHAEEEAPPRLLQQSSEARGEAAATSECA
jgi:hypothetical protein